MSKTLIVPLSLKQIQETWLPDENKSTCYELLPSDGSSHRLLILGMCLGPRRYLAERRAWNSRLQVRIYPLHSHKDCVKHGPWPWTLPFQRMFGALDHQSQSSLMESIETGRIFPCYIFSKQQICFFLTTKNDFSKNREISVFQRNDDGCVEKNLRQRHSTKKTAIENILSIQIR